MGHPSPLCSHSCALGWATEGDPAPAAQVGVAPPPSQHSLTHAKAVVVAEHDYIPNPGCFASVLPLVLTPAQAKPPMSRAPHMQLLLVPTGSSPALRPRSSGTASGSCRTRPGACVTPSSHSAPGAGTAGPQAQHVRPTETQTPLKMWLCAAGVPQHPRVVVGHTHRASCALAVRQPLVQVKPEGLEKGKKQQRGWWIG